MNKIYLIIEFLILFVLLPIMLFVFRYKMRSMVIPILLAVCIAVLIILLFDRTFDTKLLWNIKDAAFNLKRVLLLFIVGGVGLFIVVYFWDSSVLFRFSKRNFRFWLIILTFYPLLSAYPQEIFYRVFFFHRYKSIFGAGCKLIIINGFCFGLAHLFFFNPWALILSTAGGLLFAYTYSRSNSVIVTTIEHGLWGDLIFTLGLGMFFYSGAI